MSAEIINLLRRLVKEAKKWGDMKKSIYDANSNDIVDNSEKLENSTKAQVQDHNPKSHTHSINAIARAYQSSAQTIPTATDVKVNLQTENYDPGNNFSNSRFTSPVPGYYLGVGQVALMGLVDKEYVAAIIRKNGVDIVWSHQWSSQELGGAFISPIASDIVYLALNDYIELWTRHGIGSNRNLLAGSKYTFLAIHLLSET